MKEEDDDFEVIDRKHNSIKYMLAYMKQPTVDKNKAIIVSHADMEFKFSPHILQKTKQINPIPHYGYNFADQNVWKSLSSWIQNRYCGPEMSIGPSNTLLWQNTLIVINAVINATTEANDLVLLPCPTYYRFISTIRGWNRVPVELQLSTENNRLCFNFQELEETLKSKPIKLLIFTNPCNPSGRIWSKEQLTKLKDLVIKYNVFLFSDEIFSDLVEDTNKFVSMLRFPDLSKHLIYACSNSKAFNCSGHSVSYSVCNNPLIQNKMAVWMDLTASWPISSCSYLLQACYSTKQAADWKKKMIAYVQENYERFLEFAKKHLPKLIIYPLESPYMCMMDFKEYKRGKKLQDAFSSVNICPTFLSNAFVNEDEKCSLVRINMACNRNVFEQMLSRLETAFK